LELLVIDQLGDFRRKLACGLRHECVILTEESDDRVIWRSIPGIAAIKPTKQLNQASEHRIIRSSGHLPRDEPQSTDETMEHGSIHRPICSQVRRDQPITR
ncbi:MAG TPA: hypothetical protein VEO37_10995, partial [Thermoanaerobaculia bacterium]|nr:hypothetical protein [Thermoanaerobaculia bacterium]